ncbi:cell division membrane protein [Agrilactobacillus composti DSM 18527 = JCM 14202]|uniref:Cell division membrane protein n=1 Tax=Agrilactobacillus composti DSM 18527 = JCM 14202 TaxID=1423734 RepID=X0PF97_9LACO|nr:FtsW/RodA/SpoVE family cell cycle protein [Agrilactobacillus composti]KRM36696.1 cell division membrane protein [Agrilactobacillus composti DSM 18527 = JCM 14202]GAF40544.1 rod shape-determining protein RodA [Agrilactobacillus composti DSM 18527 = JCM 14202]
MREDTDGSSRIDYGIILTVMLLSLIGLVSLYVAISHDSSAGSPMRQVVIQALWYALGAIAVIIIMQFDTEQLWRVAPYAYGLGLFLLIAVLFLYSRSYFAQTGAKSWFALGPLTFQPSEVMKPAFILMLARTVNRHNSQYNQHTPRYDWLLIGKMVCVLLPVAVLLKLQNDFGTMLVFFAIFGGVLLVSGVTWKILLPFISAFVVIGAALITLVRTTWGRVLLGKVGFHAYQFDRIDSWLNPSQNTTNQGYQLWQSMKAIGSGQLAGKGFNHSTVYVPVRESDMIFSVIGENFGFVGGCLLVLLYFLLIYQMIRVIVDTKNEFYAYISTGVIMMILFHVFENIGMCIGLLPLTGIPLPFISQGGSALLGNMIGVGLIMSMRYHSKSYMFSTNENFR